MKDAYKRRRCKARIEKSARLRKLSTVTLEFAKKVVEEETGVPLVLPPTDDAVIENDAAEFDPSSRLVARDAKKVPLISEFTWTPEAVERIFRVPSGYMRDQTQRRTETIARENERTTIDLASVEQGIDVGRRAMEELLAGMQAAAAPVPTDPAAAKSTSGAASKCPFTGIYTGGTVPAEHLPGTNGGNGNGESHADGDIYLNEIGVLSAMAERRKKLDS
jgi:hypothetical protein